VNRDHNIHEHKETVNEPHMDMNRKWKSWAWHFHANNTRICNIYSIQPIVLMNPTMTC